MRISWFPSGSLRTGGNEEMSCDPEKNRQVDPEREQVFINEDWDDPDPDDPGPTGYKRGSGRIKDDLGASADELCLHVDDNPNWGVFDKWPIPQE